MSDDAAAELARQMRKLHTAPWSAQAARQPLRGLSIGPIVLNVIALVLALVAIALAVSAR